MNRFKVALEIQLAANPMGVAHELQKAMIAAFSEGIPVREDPAVWLIVDKLASLFNNSRLDVDRYGQCAEACRAHLKKEETEYVEDTDSITADDGHATLHSLDGHHSELAVGAG